MIDIVLRLRDTRFVRYFMASVGALAVDMGSFLLLLETSLPASVAAAIAYTLGIVTHWVLLSRFVFEDGVAERGRGRTQQKALFLTATWAGLALTSGIVGVAEAIGADVVISKGMAVVISFVLNYFVRKNFVFTPRRPAG